MVGWLVGWLVGRLLGRFLLRLADQGRGWTHRVRVPRVDLGHERGVGRERAADKDEERFLGRDADALADHVRELPDREVVRDLGARREGAGG